MSFTSRPKGHITLGGLLETESIAVAVRIAKAGVLGVVKVKVKFTLEQATKAKRGNRCIAVLFNLGTRWWMGGQRHAAGRFTPGKYPVPIV